MTAAGPVVLLVDDDRTTLEVFRSVLALEPELRVEAETDPQVALERARRLRPDVIVSDYQMPELDGFRLCRAVKQDPQLAGTIFIVLTGYGDTRLKVQGLELGVDEYLTKPIEAAELVARVRAALRLKHLTDEVRREKAEIETLHAALASSFDQLVSLLIRLLELNVPGAGARGQRLAQAARRVAERIEVPKPLWGAMELAAQLHEIGRIVDPPPRGAAAEGEDLAVGGAHWSYLVSARAILQGVNRFGEVAELVGAMGENWDGSGRPDHLRQGQIPMRSRILRVLADFFALWDGANADPDPVSLAAEIAAHANTRYDPAVTAQLEVIAAEDAAHWRGRARRIAVRDLREGMVLAEDLVTSSGVKLLARGARITSANLELILRRHVTDPIVYGACVET